MIDGARSRIAAPSGGGQVHAHGGVALGRSRLLSDDIVVVEAVGERIIAHPGPPLMSVPAAHPLSGREVLDTFGDELWTVVPVVDGPQPLQALVLLDRLPGAQDRLERVAPSPLPVIPRLLAYPRTAERERRRFALAGDIADAVPIHRLIADSTTTAQGAGGARLRGRPCARGGSRDGRRPCLTSSPTPSCSISPFVSRSTSSIVPSSPRRWSSTFRPAATTGSIRAPDGCSWSSSREGRVREAAGTLAEEYDQPLDLIERDLAKLCRQLLERELIELTGGTPD